MLTHRASSIRSSAIGWTLPPVTTISETSVNASNASTPSTMSKKVGFRDEPGVRTVERKSLPDMDKVQMAGLGGDGPIRRNSDSAHTVAYKAIKSDPYTTKIVHAVVSPRRHNEMKSRSSLSKRREVSTPFQILISSGIRVKSM